MKKVLLLLLLVTVTTLSQAQDNTSLGLYHDAKLLIAGDDKGNGPGTLDFKIDASLQGYQFKYYYFEVRIQFEYADLKSGEYISWIMTPNWVFNKWIKNFEYSIGPSFGMITRDGFVYVTSGGTGDISYKINSKLKLSLMGQYINRRDLEDPEFRFSGYIGIKYNILANRKKPYFRK